MRRACRGLARLARAATIGGMKEVGRLLQIVALAVLPLSIVLEYSGQLGRRWGVSDMVVMVAFGILAFVAGRLIEGYARKH